MSTVLRQLPSDVAVMHCPSTAVSGSDSSPVTQQNRNLLRDAAAVLISEEDAAGKKKKCLGGNFSFLKRKHRKLSAVNAGKQMCIRNYRWQTTLSIPATFGPAVGQPGNQRGNT